MLEIGKRYSCMGEDEIRTIVKIIPGRSEDDRVTVFFTYKGHEDEEYACYEDEMEDWERV